MTRHLLAIALLTTAAARASAQPAAPPPPERYAAQVRYRIDAPRDQHVAVYDLMIVHLKRVGFEFVPPLDTLPDTDREDRTKNRITGTIRPADVMKLFTYRHIESVVLTPPDFKPVASPDTPVRVRLELGGGLGLVQQYALARQANVVLGELGFREAAGYDHRGYTLRPHTRLVGTLPAKNVNLLLKDLRGLPGGWFGPRIAPQDLPQPLAGTVPILVTEILGEAAPPTLLPPPPKRPAPHLYRISDDLWALAGDKARQADVVRMEVLLAAAPAAGDVSWREDLRGAAPGLFVEGRLGPFVTCIARAGSAQALAALPNVSTVRLPRTARVAVSPSLKWVSDNARALADTNLTPLHQRGKRGKGVRVALLDVDFTGWEKLVKDGRLPRTTRLIDLTAGHNSELLPEASMLEYEGHGTRCALALALAAPEADLTLVRIDPDAPYMVQTVAACMDSGAVVWESLDYRRDQLVLATAMLKQRRLELLKERIPVLQDFTDEADFQRQYGILGAVGAWLYSPRQWHRLRMDEFDRDFEDHRGRETRYLKLMGDLQNLKGTHVVSSSLTWNEGYPLGNTSPLSRWFDDAGPHCFLWFQSAGNTGGQTWDGPYRDDDGNGALEFAAPSAKLPAGRWSRELNFLAWRPYEDKESLDLPDGARVQLSLQWRETHDPTLFFQPGKEDLYRFPLAVLRLVVLRQRDPDGKTLPADDLEVVARSFALPERLDNRPGTATYEIAVEFTAAKAGRYAVRVERQTESEWVLLTDPVSGRESVGQLRGLVPSGLRPLGTVTLPRAEKNWELRPRLFVEAVDAKYRLLGRPVLLDFATNVGNTGMPGDSQALVSVGAADFNNQPQPYSARGPGPGLDLALRPEVYGYDRLDLGAGATGVAYGASLATPFAAGTAATIRSAGMSVPDFLRYLHSRPRQVLQAPRRP